MNLAAAVLQMALSIVSLVNSSSLPQWQRDQAIAIANQSVQFAQAVLQQSGYNYNYNYQNYCSGYPYATYQNCSSSYYNNNNYSNQGAALTVLGPDNLDTSLLRNGQRYTATWSPFNYLNGNATVQLRNTGGGTIWIGQTTNNSIQWIVSAQTGSYQLEIVQNGAVLASRGVTVQY